MPKTIRVEPGSVFGELTVLGEAPGKRSGKSKLRRRVYCRCSCGKEGVFRVDRLQTGRTKSCGHLLGIHARKNAIGILARARAKRLERLDKHKARLGVPRTK